VRALEQLLVALGLLELVQVLALQVLDDLDLEDVGVGELAHGGRDVGQARGLRGAVAALAGDELVMPGLPFGRSRIGCSTSWRLMLSASSASCASSKRLRGFVFDGVIEAIAMRAAAFISAAPRAPAGACRPRRRRRSSARRAASA
jgi:hypothetical protein